MTTQELIKKTKLTDAEIAGRMGVSAMTVYRWRRRGSPKSVALRKLLAEVANVDRRKVEWK